MPAPLNPAVAIFNELRSRIAEAFDLEEDDEAVIDTALGETSLEELLTNILREAKARKAMAEGMDVYIKAMQARKARLIEGHDKAREAVLQAMQEAGLAKISAPDLSATITPGRRKFEYDAPRMPPEYLKVVTTYEPDKDAVKEAVDRGEVPDGVTISNSPSILTVRSR